MEDVIEFFFCFKKLRWKKGCIGFNSRNGSKTGCTITKVTRSGTFAYNSENQGKTLLVALRQA